MANDFGFKPIGTSPVPAAPAAAAPVAREAFGFKPLAEADAAPVAAREAFGFKPIAPQTDDKPSAGEALIRAGAQGVLAEWADEFTAALESTFTNKTYDQSLAESRAAYKKAEQAFPKLTIAGKIGGGIATAFVPGANLMNAASRSILGAAAVGAGAGFVAGAGASEADDAVGVLEDASKSAAFGAVGGATLAGITKGVRAIRGASVKATEAGIDADVQAAVATKLMNDMRNGIEPGNYDEVYGKMHKLWKATQDNTSIKLHDAVLPEYRRIDAEEVFDAEKVMPGRVGLQARLDGMRDIKAKWKGDKSIPKSEKTKLARQIEYAQRNMMDTINDAPEAGFINWAIGRRDGDVISAKSLKKFDALVEHHKQDGLTDLFKSYKKERALVDAVDAATENSPELMSALEDPIKKSPMFSFLANARGVFTRIDRKLGTNLSGLELRLSNLSTKYTNTVRPYLEQIDKTIGKMSAEQQDNIVKELRTVKDVSLLSEPARKINDIYQTARLHLMEYGLNIPEMPVYMPRRAMGVDDARAAILAHLDKSGWDGKALEAVRFLSGKKMGTVDAERFVRFGILDRANMQKAVAKLEASASFSRKVKGVPELLVENDLRKASFRYFAGNFRAAIYRNSMDELRRNTQAVKAMGLDSTYAFLKDYERRLMGQPGASQTYMLGLSSRLKVVGQEWMESDSSLKRYLGEGVKAMPDMLGWGMSQMYSNMMGSSLKTTVRNSMQVLQTTMPEMGLGSKEAYGITARGIARAVKERASGESVEKFLTDRNLSANITTEATLSPIMNGLRAYPWAGTPIQTIEKAGRLAMWAFAKTEQLNRYGVWHIGQELGEEIVKGGATRVLAGMPAGVKAEIRQYLIEGNHTALKDYVADYLVSKTLFNYTKADLSQFGYQFGGLANMFMKWPSTVGADIANLLVQRGDNPGSVGVLEKYMAPMAVFAAGELALRDAELSESAGVKYTVGNLLELSPLTSLPTAVGGPPVARLVGNTADALGAAFQGDMDRLERAGTRVGKDILTYTPGVGLGMGFHRKVVKPLSEAFED